MQSRSVNYPVVIQVPVDWMHSIRLNDLGTFTANMVDVTVEGPEVDFESPALTVVDVIPSSEQVRLRIVTHYY